jgi:hypothetical protein
MINVLLLVIVLGVITLALAIDIGAVIDWLRAKG